MKLWGFLSFFYMYVCFCFFCQQVCEVMSCYIFAHAGVLCVQVFMMYIFIYKVCYECLPGVEEGGESMKSQFIW